MIYSIKRILIVFFILVLVGFKIKTDSSEQLGTINNLDIHLIQKGGDNYVTQSLGQVEVLRDTSSGVSILSTNIKGDGIHDDTEGIQMLLNSTNGLVYLKAPKKNYLISKTLIIKSGQTLKLDRSAVIRLKEGARAHMITNSDHINGNSGITIEGGIWDGNNVAQSMEYHETGNFRVPFDKKRYLGVVFQLNNVTDLVFRDLTIKDPTTFGFQGGNLKRFQIENIKFDYNLKTRNMDGIHVHGNSSEGRIVNLMGSTNDDLVALNADDADIFELSRGTISDIVIDGIWSENGYRAVRLLSCGSPVNRIRISNVFGTYRHEIVSLTNHNVHPGCSSVFEDIHLDGIFASGASRNRSSPQINIESPAQVSRLVISNYMRMEKHSPTDDIYVRKGVKIGELTVHQVSATNNTEKGINFINNKGHIRRLVLSNVAITSTSVGDTLINNAGKIDSIHKSNVSE